MKKMKKILSLLLAAMLVLSMTMTAWADDPDPTDPTTETTEAAPENDNDETILGSITINGVSADTDYAIYQLLDLESYNKVSGAYSYKVNSAWEDFFATDEAKAYITIDDAGYVTWIAGEDDATVAAFAQKALAYAKEHTIDSVAELAGENVTGTVGVFSDLVLGWYLVDSTAGALCGLTTTDPDASINAKNKIPTVDKQVQEDLTGMWGDVNTADIGQIVNYMTIIHVAAGAENYVLHDIMSEGLTFEQNPDANRGITKIEHINSAGVTDNLELGTDYQVLHKDNTKIVDEDAKEITLDNACTFEVYFSKAFRNSLKPNDRIIVYYNAMLNRYANVGSTDGNENESFLEFGEDHFTTHDKTNTYTFSLDIVKTDSSNKLLDGAEFRIYDAATGGNEIAVVPLMEADDETPMLDENRNPMYRRARADEEGDTIKVKDGKVTVVGFDNGVYYLEETTAPAGYNKLTARKEFTIADGNLDSTFNDGIYSTGSGVHVVNKTGSMLPETGARGTMLFITFGMITVLGAGVLLVTKKRMGMIQE